MLPLKKLFRLPFIAKACAVLVRSENRLPARAVVFKVQLRPLDDPKAFSNESRLNWSDSLHSLYRYSEEFDSDKVMSQAYFELPRNCEEVTIEAIPWNAKKDNFGDFDFSLVAYGVWEQHNVVTVFGEQK